MGYQNGDNTVGWQSAICLLQLSFWRLILCCSFELLGYEAAAISNTSMPSSTMPMVA
jgi:uncharacterized membrane protein